MASASEVANVAEASALLADASARGRTVSIEREGGDIALSTRRLDRVLEHEAGDLTATVESGIRLAALNERLGRAGQMLALDPPGDPTVGALVAGNLTGPRRHRYGGPRDLVLGVTVVLADGTVASAGGKVVKNVAGYDLGKLFCGSHGRLGLIARVSLRLHPVPESARTLVAPVADLEDAHRRSQLIHLSALVPSALDLVWRQGDSFLALLFEGSERAVGSQLDAARGLVGGDEAGPAVWDEIRAQQARSRGRLSFPTRGLVQTLAGEAEALVRPAAGTAYLPRPVHDQVEVGARRLAERVRTAFDPAGALV